MPHHSRLAAIGIDVPAADHDTTVRFWAGALGGGAEPDADGTYVGVGSAGPAEVFVQRMGEGSARVHLDIETDDVDAEVARLEALGAERVRKVRTWWVMRDPAGLPFCVVRPQTEDFPTGATAWP